MINKNNLPNLFKEETIMDIRFEYIYIYIFYKLLCFAIFKLEKLFCSTFHSFYYIKTVLKI